MPGRRDDTKMSGIQGMQLIQEVASSTGTFHEELKVLAFDRTTIGGGGGGVVPRVPPACAAVFTVTPARHVYNQYVAPDRLLTLLISRIIQR